MPALVIATNNAGKRDDMRALLAEVPQLHVYGLITMREAGFTDWEPDETGADFAENARIKAQSAAILTGLPALADDSGLCIDSLDGAPGLNSARWLGPGAVDADKNAAILSRLSEVATAARSAHFICALAFALPDGSVEVREGRCHGRIAEAPFGANGFGYDPIFIPMGETRTLAQLAHSEKNAISHRRNAWSALAPAACGLLKSNT